METSNVNELVISNLTPSKSAIQLLSNQIASIVQSGTLPPIEAAIRLKAIEELAKDAQEKIKMDVLFDAGNYPSGKAEMFGCTLQTMEYGVKYDYSTNEEWRILDQQIKDLTERKKSIEDKLKKIPQGKVLVDEETGETLTAPVKTSTTSFKITLAK